MSHFILKIFSRRQVCSAACACFLLFCWRSHAMLPLPDQVIYGTIAIQNRAVTNNNSGTNVVIEARRSSDNQLLASYRMGSSTSQGQLFYVLRVPMEDAPASSTAVAQPDDTLVVTVKKLNVAQFTATNLLLNSGTALRLDFGASVDTDGDGIPDGWELAHSASRDSDGDGVPDAAEFTSGTSPTNPNDLFRLSVRLDTNGNTQVSFLARAAVGVGYAGLTRYYSLETKTSPAGGSWAVVPNFDRVQGTNQLVTYDLGVANGSQFFRGHVWLEGTSLSPDANGDGIPDDWQLAYLGTSIRNANGISDLANYVAGTDPNNPSDVFRLNILGGTNGTTQVSFHALPAAGIGYEGRTRYYAIETSTNLNAATWQTVPNFSRIKGTNQVQIYTAPMPGNAPAYFRSRVWLEGP
jgi:hypothetical protein